VNGGDNQAGAGKLRGQGARVDFARVNRAALDQAEAVARGLLPDGRREGSEWVARNPKREDRTPGSFKVSLSKGAWGDWACDARGGDLVSLAAYLTGLSQRDAAIRLAESLGVDPFE
jgi:hypothetical protein